MLHHAPGQPVLHRVLVAFGERLPFGVAELLHVLSPDLLGHHVCGSLSSCLSGKSGPKKHTRKKNAVKTMEQKHDEFKSFIGSQLISAMIRRNVSETDQIYDSESTDTIEQTQIYLIDVILVVTGC